MRKRGVFPYGERTRLPPGCKTAYGPEEDASSGPGAKPHTAQRRMPLPARVQKRACAGCKTALGTRPRTVSGLDPADRDRPLGGMGTGCPNRGVRGDEAPRRGGVSMTPWGGAP